MSKINITDMPVNIISWPMSEYWWISGKIKESQLKINLKGVLTRIVGGSELKIRRREMTNDLVISRCQQRLSQDGDDGIVTSGEETTRAARTLVYLRDWLWGTLLTCEETSLTNLPT